jgi:putative transposase
VRGHRVSARGAYYHLRATTSGRIAYLGTSACKRAVVDVLRRVSARLAFDVLAYVVMPEHVHLVVCQRGVQDISDLMAALKRESAHRINLLLHRQGPVWRKEFYDHILRSWEHADELVRYIHDNPVRRGLVQAAQDWEFSSWHEIYGDPKNAALAVPGTAPERVWRKRHSGAPTGRGKAASKVAPSEA